MKLSRHRQRIRPRHRFATSQWAVDEKETIVIELEHDGVVGLGEVVPSALYGQSLESSEAALDALAPLLGDDPFALQAITHRLVGGFDGQRAAIAGVDAALHDWVGKRLGVPVWKLLGLDRPRKQTTFTIGVAELDDIRVKLEEALAAGFDALKVKVGVEHDHETLSIIREAFDGPLLLDANQAWEPREAPGRIKELVRYRPTMIESSAVSHSSPSSPTRAASARPTWCGCTGMWTASTSSSPSAAGFARPCGWSPSPGRSTCR
jgi:L-alanine-DL-glutamate epimerase-like enolase superfamily enzyme